MLLNRLLDKRKLLKGLRMSSTLEKPLLDARVYDQIILSNGIVATMIHDGSLNRSSCAFAVKVGASSDPIQYPGLAHFTEHMLFLGTDKYPKESHYKDFLNKHGGTSNASTSMETTVYNFDVNYNYFSEALDIFSQFFISPLFDMNSTSRELRAVDSEVS
jgi:insulysin